MNKENLNIEKFVDLFFSIEKKFDLLNFEVDGVFIWQYIRMEIYYDLTNKLGLLEERHLSQGGTKSIVNSIFSLLKNSFIRNPFLVKKKEYEILVFSHNRSKDFESQKIDIYTHFYVQQFKEKKQDFLIFEKPFNGKHVRKIDENVVYLDFLLTTSIFFSKFYKIQDKHAKFKIEEIEEEFFEKFGIRLELFNLFQKNIGRFKRSYKYYDKLLIKFKPKQIYILAAYSYLGDIICAAKDHKIMTYEIQHGVISDYHLGYSYSELVNLKYAPDYFISWGKYWNKFVKNLFNERIINDGFTYFNILKEKYVNNEKEKHAVLVISQTALGNSIMKNIFQLKDKLSDFNVYYKLHPEEYLLYRDYEYYYPLASQKNITFLENCDIYEYMAKCSVQIGVFSTAIFEGLAFDCNTFLLNLSGIEYMRDLIQDNYVEVIDENTNFEKSENIKFNSKDFF